MRLLQITEIQRALTELGKEKLPVAYELAKNIRLCNEILTEAQELAKELHTKFADKDENGEVIIYEEEINNTKQQISKISDPAQLTMYKAELDKLEAEEHEVAFKTIQASKITTALEANKLLSLVDIIVVE